MKILKGIVLGLGLVALVTAVVFVGLSVIDINQMHAVAQANRSAGYPNPRNRVLFTLAITALTGLLLGLGIAMPTQLRRKSAPPEDQA